MPVWRILLAAVLIAVAVPATASTFQAQTGPSMEVDLGVGGFTSVDRPSDVIVDIASPVLLSGRLRVRGGGVSLSRPVEVPAGSEQTYRLTIPPLDDGTRLTVEVLDGDDEELVSEAITTRAPSGEEMAVGVMGSDDLVNQLGRVRTVVTDRPVAAFPVPLDASDANLAALDYLVVPRQGEDGLESALRWARAGGRVVLDSSLGAGAGVTDLLPMGPEGVDRGAVGSGTALVVEGMDARSAEDWAAILRPAPLDLSRSSEGRPMGDTHPLLQAASEAGSRQVPSLPWLLFAILGFAALVGPVNFIVLSRIGKRDWAWLTIPALALFAVVGFWVAGRQRIGGTNLTHASVISEEGTIQARSAVLVAAGVAGERQISFDPSTEVYPERPLAGGSGPELRLLGDDSAAVDLEQLGFTGIGLFTPDPAVDLPRVSVEGDRLVVENPGEMSFWGWGATSAGASTVSNSDLGPNASGEVPVPRGGGREFGFGFIDALINERQLWEDPARNNSLWPLSQVLFTEADPDGLYFVGLTDDFRPDVSSPGAGDTIPGPTLVMVKVEGVASDRDTGAVVVDTGFVNWVDWGAQQVISSDEMTVRFQLPDPSLSPELIDSRRFGGAPSEYEAWDWGSGEFVAIELGEPLPVEMVAPDGEVYVRLVGANEFGDNPMSPRDLTLEWEA